MKNIMDLKVFKSLEQNGFERDHEEISIARREFRRSDREYDLWQQ